MRRHITNELLNILDTWLSGCYSCVKWLTVWSDMFQTGFSVRQGSVLSPFLFAVYLDDLANLCHNERHTFVVLYADDILLLAPSVCQLDALLKISEHELTQLDMAINFKKSCCLRVGSRMTMPYLCNVRYPDPLGQWTQISGCLYYEITFV